MTKACRIVCLTLVLSLVMHSEATAWQDNKILAAMGSATGVAVVAFAYNILNGAANWVWAYDWTRNNVTDANSKARIQEAGGLTSAALSWMLAGLVPLYRYLYAQHVKRHQTGDAVATAEPSVGIDKVMDALSTPKGVAIVAFVYAVASGTATFLWAFNFTRDGLSSETNARLQEAGGLTSAVLSWSLGGIIPFYCYLYSEYMNPSAENSLASVPGHSNRLLNALATTKGIAAIGLVYGILNGAATWLWAYNWTRAGVSSDLNSRIQEAAGLASAALSWTLAGFVPLYLYLYMKHVECRRAQTVLPVTAPALG